ncbi:MAG: YfdX family protein [Gammaproteobacteria bacterium]
MNRHALKKITATIAIALAASVGSPYNVIAATDTPASASKPARKDSLTEKRKLLTERLQTIEHEAHDAIQGTRNVLLALHNKDDKKALTLLQDVSGKVDILLAKNPSLALLPAEVSADIYDFEGDSKQIEKLVDEADDLLDDHNVQDARHILAELVSEIRINTTNIPLGTFPVAIKAKRTRRPMLYSMYSTC